MEQQSSAKYCAPSWHMDCLGVVTVLGLGFNRKQLQRLAVKFGLMKADGEPDTAQLFLDLHEACHSLEPLVREINKDLGKRFGGTLKKVRSSSGDTLRECSMEFPLPFLWAALSDHREEVRLEGRRRLHEVLGEVFTAHRRGELKENGAEDTIRALTHENHGLRKERDELQKEIKRLREEAQELKKTARAAAPPRREREPVHSAQKVCRRQQREMKKLAHTLAKERERAAALEEELLSVTSARGHAPVEGDSCDHPKNTVQETDLCPRCCEQGGFSLQRGTIVCRGKGDCSGGEGKGGHCPLEKMKVAIVGGTEKTFPEYRCMVRELGGECLYHDGCTGSGVDRLRRIISSADVVVCITTLNSHGAMKIAKSICKRRGKRFLVTRERGACSLREMLLQRAV